MVLSDSTLRERIALGDIFIDPLADNAIQPSSIDCRLGDHFLVLDEHAMQTIKLDEPITYREITADTLTIPPRSFVLANTLEYIKCPTDLTFAIEGRSSIGRTGLFIHNAGWGDPGFEGTLTLELFNANSLPITLHAGRRICQLVFYKLDKPASESYGASRMSKYKGQRGATGSMIFQDIEIKQ
ncbi:dCTP deaminase [Candidatus Uhrbacteria bacterium]|nr:dCTP deaminase [Candidatus Uhrbacteria bacterium]